MSSTATFTYSINVITDITIGIGFIGHIVSIMVFLRKPFRNNSISTYCIALAIAESLSLVKFVDTIGYFVYNSDLSHLSEEICKSFTYLITLLSSIQPCIMVVFSIDKLLSMKTRSFPILKKKWFQLLLVAASVLFNVAIYIYFPIFLKRREIFPGYFVCDVSAMSFFNILTAQTLIETFILPFIILIITSVLTIRELYKSRNAIERVGNVSKERKSRDKKYAFTSVTLNILFVILKLPFLIFFILNAYLSYFDVYFYNIVSYLFFLYTSLGFFVHLITNSIFRREFLLLFRLSKTNEAISSISNSRIIRVTPIDP